MNTIKKSTLFSASSLQSLAIAGSAVALLAAAPARAQDEPQDADVTGDDTTIIVTGTLIQNPNLEQSNPVNVTTADQIELKQSNTAEEVLREIPGIVGNIGSGVNNGNNGSSYVDLRGLGSNRNIVLLDGNRLPPSSLTTAGGASAVDLNTIPLALISRVNSLTGAAVTTYGADAITGVINFITKKDFAGLKLAASQQITEEGDGNYFRVDATVGANFDDGRGNAVLSIGYQDSDPVFQGDRDYSFFQLSSYSGGANGSGLAAVPARFSGTRRIDPLTGLPSTDPAVANNGASQLNPATGLAGPTFAPFNFNPFNIFQTPFERFNIYSQANYEVSDAVEVYARGLYTKSEVVTIVAPSGSFTSPVAINLNNPFLPAQLRRQFCGANISTTPGVYTPLFTPAVCDAAALATGPTDPRYRTVTTNLSRRAVEVGNRVDDYTTSLFDIRAGARGALTDTIDWDISGAYGEGELDQQRLNYTLQSRFRQGVLVNGTLANPVCQDPSGGCVPVNIFGNAGTISPAAADFLSANVFVKTKTSLAQARAVVSGDFGFALPSANEPIGFALGGEYRRYRAQQLPDVLAQNPGEVGGAGGARLEFDGIYDVYEAYGELIAPIVEDKPFFESLTLEAGARYSHYKVRGGDTNNTFTYKVGASWEPGAGVKFRGNYSKAVRAPNIYELFLPPNTILTNLAVDPCAGAAPVANANLRAVCLAQGAPLGSIGVIENPAAGQANITTLGSVNLDPEKAKTYTFGVVWQPEFLPRFSISADYYHIRVTDVIGAALPGDLIALCFGSLTAASAADPNCTGIRRDPISGSLLSGDPGTTPGLLAPFTNQGKLLTDGIDLIANYNTDLGFADWAINFVGNWTNRSKFQATPVSIFRECVGFYSVNCSFTGSLQPEFQWSLRNTFTIDDIDLSLLWRHIDTMRQEPDDVINSGPAFMGTLGPDTLLNGREVNFGKIAAYDIFDMTIRFNASDNMTFTATVQNLFDTTTPIVGNTIGSTTFNSGNTYPATYDALGRRFGVGAKLKF